MAWRIKNGHWVTVGGKVGIVFSAGPDDSTVHFVDGSGETVDSVVVPNHQLRRARAEDVPEPRRKDFEETVRQLGSSREEPVDDRPNRGPI